MKTTIEKTGLNPGDVFGSWTVLRFSHSTKAWHKYYLCKCSCGKTKLVLRSTLISGSSKSCGHSRHSRKLVIGSVVGNWTILNAVPHKKYDPRYNCRCICGKEKIINTKVIYNGEPESCGCIRSQRKNDAFYKIFNIYILSAKKRGLSFEISEEKFKELSQQNCNYCGSPPASIRKSRNKFGLPFRYNGLDRVDSSKNYTIDNVVPCCKRCNYFKHKHSVDVFIQWVTRIYNNFSNEENK